MVFHNIEQFSTFNYTIRKDNPHSHMPYATPPHRLAGITVTAFRVAYITAKLINLSNTTTAQRCFCTHTVPRHRHDTTPTASSLRRILKVETQNLASHKQHTLLQHADYNRNKLPWLPWETQDFASLQAYAIVMKQQYSPFYYAAC